MCKNPPVERERVASSGRKGCQLSHLPRAGGLKGPEPRPLRGEGNWRRGGGDGGSGSWSPMFIDKALPLLFPEKIKDVVKGSTTLTNQEGGAIGMTVTKAWEIMTDSAIFSSPHSWEKAL